MIVPDQENFSSLVDLYDTARDQSKPIVLWIGAGASRWGNLPSWEQLADNLHREFSRKEPNYQSSKASAFFKESNYPGIFSLCKSVSSSRYHRILSDSLTCTPKNQTPIYDRFIKSLKSLQPLRIITTNADELLERKLDCKTLLPPNFEQFHHLLNSEESHVAKIHGSISDLHTLIFTKEDYIRATTSISYIRNLTRIFETCSVIFVGYGLADDYIARIIAESENCNQLFSQGPHFACLPASSITPPRGVKLIKYDASTHKDHRTPIAILEELGRNRLSTKQPSYFAPIKKKSAHMLSDVFCDGEWIGSQTCEIVSPEGNRIFLEVGQGFTSKEIAPTAEYSLHDLIVGLICFDSIYAPLSSLTRLALLVGQDKFEILAKEGIINLVRYSLTSGVVYEKQTDALGFLVTLTSPESNDLETEYTNLDLIKKHLHAIPGREKEAASFMQLLADRVIEIEKTHLQSTDTIARSLLMRRSLRESIGMSEGTNADHVPRWLSTSLRRLSNVIRCGITCRELEIASIQFESGNDLLAGPAFSATFGPTSASDIASYIVAGTYGTNLGKFAKRNPNWLSTILQFRDTTCGQSLRFDILQLLERSEANEINAAINSGLSQAIPIKDLIAGHSTFSSFSISQNVPACPGIWKGTLSDIEVLNNWKERSRAQFMEICRSGGHTAYSPCPCGSGEKAKFCCGEALGAIW